MLVRLPGFPIATGPTVELPDIGELLFYPAFHGIGAEAYRRYASAFQKRLLDRLPLRHDRKNVLIRSGVWLLEPWGRTHVNRSGDWHIDGKGDCDHIEPQERVHILSSPCRALTEFNVNPLQIESVSNETRFQLASRLRDNLAAFGVIGRAIEPCRVYTFENHLHRAVEPERIEFRFFFRVRETDDPPFTTAPVDKQYIHCVSTGKKIASIIYHQEGLVLQYPRTLRDPQGSESGLCGR